MMEAAYIIALARQRRLAMRVAQASPTLAGDALSSMFTCLSAHRAI